METLLLVLGLYGCAGDAVEAHELVVEAAQVAELCDGPESCEDEWSSVYDLLAESGVDVRRECE